jgi:hypothetical protein
LIEQAQRLSLERRCDERRQRVAGLHFRHPFERMQR